MRYEDGDGIKQKVRSFLGRCTEAQRAAGLPPDGEDGDAQLALRAPGGRDGTVYTVVPARAREGDSFFVDGASGEARGAIRVRVPEGVQAGQVLAVTARPRDSTLSDARAQS
jgi:hypothetical protein